MKRMLTPCFVLIAGALSIIHCGSDSDSGSSGAKGSGGKGGSSGSGTGGVSGSGTGGFSGSGTGGVSGSGTGGASGSGTGGASGSSTGGASGSGTGGGGSLTDAANNDPDCPSTEPAGGSSCADAGVNRGACRYSNGSICFCGGGGGTRNWTCVTPDGGGFGGNGFGGGTFDGGLQCPSMQPTNGGNCFGAGRTCPYPNATCTCRARDGGNGNGWSCQ
jgi:hypothetical protein